MGKTFVVFDDQEVLMIERICLDKDPSEALEFILKHVSPKIEKKQALAVGHTGRRGRRSRLLLRPGQGWGPW